MFMYYGAAVNCAAILASTGSQICTDMDNVHPASSRFNGYGIVYTDIAIENEACTFDYQTAIELQSINTYLNRIQSGRAANIWEIQTVWSWDPQTSCDTPISDVASTIGTYGMVNWNFAYIHQSDACTPNLNVSSIITVSETNTSCSDIITTDTNVRSNILSFGSIRVRKSIERYAEQILRDSRLHTKFKYINLLFIIAVTPLMFAIIYAGQHQMKRR